MRRHRNPRYAPESLERKLNPSGVIGIPVAAEVYIPETQQIASPTAIDPTLTQGGITPDGPVPVATTSNSEDAPEPDPMGPGAPEPPAPTDPGDGSEPPPPYGDGTPPLDMPSFPGGPPVPAGYP